MWRTDEDMLKVYATIYSPGKSHQDSAYFGNYLEEPQLKS